MSRVQSRELRVKVEGIYVFFSVSNFFDICLNNKVYEQFGKIMARHI